MSSYGNHAVSSTFPADFDLLAATKNSVVDEDVAPEGIPEDSTLGNPYEASVSHERTPLLPPSVPRIHEEVQDLVDSNGASGRFSVYFEELGILMKYTLPVFGTHVLEYSLVIAGTISLGHLSTNALAAGALGAMTASVSGLSVIQGFVTALDTLLPSAWTSNQPNLVGLWCLRISVLMFALLFPIFAVWFNSEAILLALKQDPEIAHLASTYLKYLSIGMPAYAVNNISRRYFQSQGLFAVPTRIIFVIAPINAGLNWFLVWGPEPVRLGFIGAPLASAISFNLIAIASVLYGAFFVPKTAWHPISGRMFTKLGTLLHLGLAGVVQVGSEWWSWELINFAASFLGPVSLAAQSVLLASGSTTFQAPFALSVATAIRVGNLLGEGNPKRAAVVTKTALAMALAISFVWCAMYMVFRKSWGRVFNDDPEVLKLVAGVLPLVALFQIFDGVAAIANGILSAQGKQATGAMLNLSAYYVIGIPLGLFLTFKLGMSLWGLWIGLVLALLYRSSIGGFMALRTDWDHEVKKVQDRIEAENHQGFVDPLRPP